jgi:hypothetical protein
VDTIKYEYGEGEFTIHRSERSRDVNKQWTELKKKHGHLKVHAAVGPDPEMMLDYPGMLFQNKFFLKKMFEPNTTDFLGPQYSLQTGENVLNSNPHSDIS